MYIHSESTPKLYSLWIMHDIQSQYDMWHDFSGPHVNNEKWVFIWIFLSLYIYMVQKWVQYVSHIFNVYSSQHEWWLCNFQYELFMNGHLRYTYEITFLIHTECGHRWHVSLFFVPSQRKICLQLNLFSTHTHTYIYIHIYSGRIKYKPMNSYKLCKPLY